MLQHSQLGKLICREFYLVHTRRIVNMNVFEYLHAQYTFALALVHSFHCVCKSYHRAKKLIQQNLISSNINNMETEKSGRARKKETAFHNLN